MRIGQRMIEVWYYVSRHPGCSQSEAVQATKGDQTTERGRRAVKRAIDHGIVNAEGNPQTGYKLTAVPVARWRAQSKGVRRG